MSLYCNSLAKKSGEVSKLNQGTFSNWNPSVIKGSNACTCEPVCKIHAAPKGQKLLIWVKLKNLPRLEGF